MASLSSSNCIYRDQCMESICNESCITFAQCSYLLEQNGLSMNNPATRMTYEEKSKLGKILEEARNLPYCSYIAKDTNSAADKLAYSLVCSLWPGSNLHTVVYKINLAQYIQQVQNSWSTRGGNESLEYVKIWVETAQVLIIHGTDFMNFKDFSSEVLLQLLGTRISNGKTTIVVRPKEPLIGTGLVFNKLITLLDENKLGE